MPFIFAFVFMFIAIAAAIGAGIFSHVGGVLSPGNRDHVRVFGQQPGQGNLPGGGASCGRTRDAR